MFPERREMIQVRARNENFEHSHLLATHPPTLKLNIKNKRIESGRLISYLLAIALLYNGVSWWVAYVGSKSEEYWVFLLSIEPRTKEEGLFVIFLMFTFKH